MLKNVPLGHHVNEVLVRGVELQAVVHVQPGDVGGVVARLQVKVPEDRVAVVVEAAHLRLHPGVVGVARVVHVAPVDGRAPLEEAVELARHRRVPLGHQRVGRVGCLLQELPLQRLRHRLARVAHSLSNAQKRLCNHIVIVSERERGFDVSLVRHEKVAHFE